MSFTPNTEGTFRGLPFSQYLAAPGVSQSMLKHMDPPARLPAYLAEKREPTEEMILGTLAHSAILEPEKPLPGIVVPPETYPAPSDCTAVKQKKAQPGDPLAWHWSATYCKRWYAEAVEAGLIVLTEERMETLRGVIRSVSLHDKAAELFSTGQTEVSVFSAFVGRDWSVLRKCRIDHVPTGNVLGDIKTVPDADPETFQRRLHDDGWACQAAHYLDLWNDQNPDDWRDGFVYVLVEKKAPYLVATYNVGARTLDAARVENERRIRLYHECQTRNHWPGFSASWVTVDMKEWDLKKYQP
ncbi:MAG: hypothetical protein E6Q97_14980 [Desulfurellales bacterium]|nr:MAG: hypothetical protein E6Q97_14980 [Desulfurellales bacterium]